MEQWLDPRAHPPNPMSSITWLTVASFSGVCPPLGQGGSTHRAGGCGEGPLLKPGRASGPGAIQGAVAGASRACRAQWGRKENAASFESVNKVGFLTTFKRAALSTSASGSQGMSEKAGGEGMGFHPELDS